MRKIIIILLVVQFCIFTKCADKEFYIQVINKSKNNYLMYKKTESIPLNDMVKKRNAFAPYYIMTKKNEIVIDKNLTEYDLDFYRSKEGEFYTFYFYKYKTFIQNDHIKYIVEKKYDSINVNADLIKLGSKERNIFIFENGKIYFKN